MISEPTRSLCIGPNGAPRGKGNRLTTAISVASRRDINPVHAVLPAPILPRPAPARIASER